MPGKRLISIPAPAKAWHLIEVQWYDKLVVGWDTLPEAIHMLDLAERDLARHIERAAKRPLHLVSFDRPAIPGRPVDYTGTGPTERLPVVRLVKTFDRLRAERLNVLSALVEI